MNYPGLLNKIKDYALLYYKDHADDRLVYHDIGHTEKMVEAATHIGNHYQLNDRDFFVIHAAAWFHDLGYMVDIKRHEEEGSAIAENFIRSYDVDNDTITQIKGCIMATQMPQNPHNQLERIVCDADLFHLGTDDFFKTDKQLLKELATIHGIDMTKNEWRKKSIKFLESHHYHTDYCQVLLNSGKQRNIQILKDKVAAYDAKHANDSATSTT